MQIHTGRCGAAAPTGAPTRTATCAPAALAPCLLLQRLAPVHALPDSSAFCEVPGAPLTRRPLTRRHRPSLCPTLLPSTPPSHACQGSRQPPAPTYSYDDYADDGQGANEAQGLQLGWSEQEPGQPSRTAPKQPSGYRATRPPAPPQDPYPPLPSPSQGNNQFAAFQAFQQLAALRDGPGRGAVRQRRPGGGNDPMGTLDGPGRYVQGGRGAGPGFGRGWDDAGGGPWPAQRGGVGGGAQQALWEQGPMMGGQGGGEQGRDWDEPQAPGARLAAFRKMARTGLRKAWYAQPGLTCRTVCDEVMRKAALKEPDIQALFMLMRLANTPTDLRMTLSACVAVRGAVAASGGERRPLGGPNLAMAFAQACVRCDAPDVLASALLRANEAGLLLSYACIHMSLIHWANLQEMHKVDQILEAMSAGGLPYRTQTAYVAIRGAVNAGRQQTAEGYADMFQRAGVRLHPTTTKLLELGRQRAVMREEAIAATTGQAAAGAAAAAGRRKRQAQQTEPDQGL